MKKVFVLIWFMTGLASSAMTPTCGELCDESFWATATVDDVRTLIVAGADVNASDGLGGTPLHWAATAASGGSIAALIEAGADLNAVDENAWTPLELAIFFGTPESVTTLTLAGAEINTNAMIGWTPLHLAALLGTAGSVDALLSLGADGGALNDDGETPYDMAQFNPNLINTPAYWALGIAKESNSTANNNSTPTSDE